MEPFRVCPCDGFTDRDWPATFFRYVLHAYFRMMKLSKILRVSSVIVQVSAIVAHIHTLGVCHADSKLGVS